MDKKTYTKICSYFPKIDEYKKEVDLIESFWSENGSPTLDEVYWNHLLTLLERVDTDTQNNLDVVELDDIGKDAIDLTDKFISYLEGYRAFNLTPFEMMLLSIYSQKFYRKEEKWWINQ